MLHTRTDPTGIDVPIQVAQKRLHDRLNELWGITLQAYGRAYLLKKEDKIIPEVFTSNQDYEDVLSLDDNRFFFVQKESSEKVDNKWFEGDVDVYFILKLDDIYKELDHRADEEAHRDVDHVLNQTKLNVETIEIGIDNVISDFKIRDHDNFNYSDFEPYHIFKLTCNVRYDLATAKCNV